MSITHRHCFFGSLLLVIWLTSLQAGIADQQSLDKQLGQRLFEHLAQAEDEQQGRTAEAAIWRYWFDQSPSESVREALDAGMSRRDAYDYEAAEMHLDRVVEMAPDYAEGYNQRAFVRFLRENLAGATTDLEKALEIEPRHFGAMSGLYHVLRLQNRQKAALGMLQAAVAIHPWIKERHGLPEAMWPESYRRVHSADQEI